MKNLFIIHAIAGLLYVVGASGPSSPSSCIW